MTRDIRNNQDNSKHKYQSYQYPQKDKKILAKMSSSSYEGNFLLPPNASLLEKTKYRICKQILSYERDNELTTVELAKRIGLLTVSETREVLLCRIHKFTLDKLTSCLANLLPNIELGILQKTESKG